MSEQVALSLAAWLDAPVPGDADGMMVYECERPGYNADRLRALAATHGLTGPVLEDDDVCMVQDERRALCMYRVSGAHWYADAGKLWHPDYPPQLPDDAVAIRVAAAYLRFGAAMIGGEAPSVTRRAIRRFDREGTRQEELDNHLDVSYRSGLDGIPLTGPGAKSRVSVGDRGEIIGAFHVEQTFRPLQRYAMRTRAELVDILVRKHGVPRERLRVWHSALAYYVESPVLDRRYVQPVYVVQLEAERGAGEGRGERGIRFRPAPIPATTFAPVVLIDERRRRVEIGEGALLRLSCEVTGGTPPFRYRWASHLAGPLGDGAVLEVSSLLPAWREEMLLAHEITVTVTDANGISDCHAIAVSVIPGRPGIRGPLVSGNPAADQSTYSCGVEWCNDYSSAGLPTIHGTDESALGFSRHIEKLRGWSCRFAWGNDAAWERDFKDATAGGGTDTRWVDNVDIAFFAGHGDSWHVDDTFSECSLKFNASVDDHELIAAEARWGDGRLRWMVLHSCECLMEYWSDKWYRVFHGLHTIFGFHTDASYSDPPLGARFAYWASHTFPEWGSDEALDLQTAWSIACGECYDRNVQYAVLSARLNGQSMRNDHLPGFGSVVSPDPISPHRWEYYRNPC